MQTLWFSCFRHVWSRLSPIQLQTNLTVIKCQLLNHKLQIPAALCLACHILFRLPAPTVTIVCLQCVQILDKTPHSTVTEIKTSLRDGRKKVTFVLFGLKYNTSFCSLCHVDQSCFYFRNSWCIVGTVVQGVRVVHCISSLVLPCSMEWCFTGALMFRASFESKANVCSAVGLEPPDSFTTCRLSADENIQSFVLSA